MGSLNMPTELTLTLTLSVEKKKEEGAKERIRLPSERYFENLPPRNPGAHGCDGAGQGVVKKPPTAP